MNNLPILFSTGKISTGVSVTDIQHLSASLWVLWEEFIEHWM